MGFHNLTLNKKDAQMMKKGIKIGNIQPQHEAYFWENKTQKNYFAVAIKTKNALMALFRDQT